MAIDRGPNTEQTIPQNCVPPSLKGEMGERLQRGGLISGIGRVSFRQPPLPATFFETPEKFERR